MPISQTFNPLSGQFDTVSKIALTAVGASPNANGASLSADQILTLQPANASFPGVLTAADWNTFNNKQSALTFGNLTDVGTDGIVITGGTGAVIGAGTSIAQHVADSTHNGYLSSTDWSTFNGKQAAGNYITALTGDVTATGPGSVAATIANNAVTNAKLAQMAAHTFKGNNTGSTANALDLTATQLTAELNQFTNTLQGVVPGSGGGTTNFLRADGTWATPTGGAAPRSQVTAYTGNGHGSTNTTIRRFSNSSTTGSAITYADSSTDGATFTINTTGVYTISYTDVRSGAANTNGISVNSNQLTTAIDQISIANRIAWTNSGGATLAANCCGSFNLTAGDIVRAHDSGASTGNTDSVQFTIVQVSN